MSSTSSYDYLVNLGQFTLSLDLLDNLASEYYGSLKVLAATGESNEVSISFHDLTHPILHTVTKGKDCLDDFTLTLENYRIPDPSI